jgi:hypothetical protein
VWPGAYGRHVALCCEVARARARRHTRADDVGGLVGAGARGDDGGGPGEHVNESASPSRADREGGGTCCCLWLQLPAHSRELCETRQLVREAAAGGRQAGQRASEATNHGARSPALSSRARRRRRRRRLRARPGSRPSASHVAMASGAVGRGGSESERARAGDGSGSDGRPVDRTRHRARALAS